MAATFRGGTLSCTAVDGSGANLGRPWARLAREEGATMVVA